jgi:hypothetical protein
VPDRGPGHAVAAALVAEQVAPAACPVRPPSGVTPQASDPVPAISAIPVSSR